MTSCKKNRQEHKKNCPAYFMPIMSEFYVGKCCDCIKLHKDTQCIPPCYFTEEQIKESKDFSIKRFVQLNHKCSCNINNKLLDETEKLVDSIDIKF